MAGVKNKNQPKQRLSKPNYSEKINGIYQEKIIFTFDSFKFYPINIQGVFNNYYENEDDFIAKTTVLLAEALPMFSNETIRDLLYDKGKSRKFHFHDLKGKEEILEQVLKEYNFPEQKIKDMIYGENLYQFTIEAKRGATRIVVERLENIFSILFIDVNHHIYFNPKLGSETLFYEHCPEYIEGVCDTMNYTGDCFAFGCLDEDRIYKSYGYTHGIVK